MSMNKPAASLTSSLLAPKGAARPSSPTFGTQAPPPGQPKRFFNAADARDLTERAEQELSKPGALPKPAAQPKAKKAAFTFRMDESRHLRMRLLSAHSKMSSQKILEAALDGYLELHAPQSEGSNCPCFAEAVGE